MRFPITIACWLLLCLAFPDAAQAQMYPDQHYVLTIDSLVNNIESNDGVVLSGDGKKLVLLPDRTNGSVTLKAQTSQYPFDEGLPSWNGSARDSNSSFKVQMRFPYGTGWSPWLTVGFWKSNIWSSYGATSYGGGYIDIDNAKLYSYVNSWQFKIVFTRTALDTPSPAISTVSFYVSDSRTTSSIDFNQILNDRPASIFMPTSFIYQYGVDPQLGENICSPTTVAMILRSYGIVVDPLQFARDTHDPYYNMFGIWPRVVQNAAEYGLDGAVTRYRTWSAARAVLARGGRIGMSVGLPLYAGHLMMLGGFTVTGDPIVHDPARSDGYAHVYNKSDLSHSWFDKGGVAYTFFPAGTVVQSVERFTDGKNVAEGFQLLQNYPNPFNPSTVVSFLLPAVSDVRLTVYDLLGREISTLVDGRKTPGRYEIRFDASGLSSGVYVYRLTAVPQESGRTATFTQTRSMVVLK